MSRSSCIDAPSPEEDPRCRCRHQSSEPTEASVAAYPLFRCVLCGWSWRAISNLSRNAHSTELLRLRLLLIPHLTEIRLMPPQTVFTNGTICVARPSCAPRLHSFVLAQPNVAAVNFVPVQTNVLRGLRMPVSATVLKIEFLPTVVSPLSKGSTLTCRCILLPSDSCVRPLAGA